MPTKGRVRNGAIEFYESTTNETVDAFAPLWFGDDFLNPSLVIPASTALESGVLWAKKIVGAAPPTLAGVANDTNGTVLAHLTSDVQKQNADLYQADQLVFNATQGLVFEARIKVSVIPTLHAEAVWGVAGAWADGPDAITYSAFFTADGSGEIFCEADDNATDSSVTSGVTVVNTDYHVYRIDFADVTSVKFYIDGQRVASGTTIPWAATAANSKVQPYISCYKVGDDAGLCDVTVDYVRLFQKRS